MITPGGGAFPFAVVGELEQAEQEPMAEVVLRNQTVGFGRTEERKDVMFLADVDVGTKLYAKSQQKAEQEPVAWVDLTKEELHQIEMTCETSAECYRVIAKALKDRNYAAPVRTKDLTDDEISEVVFSIVKDTPTNYERTLCRAVIAADREKNK